MTFNRDAYSILDRFEFFVAIPIDRLAAMMDTLRAMPLGFARPATRRSGLPETSERKSGPVATPAGETR